MQKTHLTEHRKAWVPSRFFQSSEKPKASHETRAFVSSPVIRKVGRTPQRVVGFYESITRGVAFTSVPPNYSYIVPTAFLSFICRHLHLRHSQTRAPSSAAPALTIPTFLLLDFSPDAKSLFNYFQRQQVGLWTKY